MSPEMTAPSKGRARGESEAVRGNEMLSPLPGLDVERGQSNRARLMQFAKRQARQPAP